MLKVGNLAYKKGAADWDEDWDKFEEDGFAAIKELTIEVEKVVPTEKSKPEQVQKKKNFLQSNDHDGEPSWGPTFDRTDDTDSVWSFNPKESDHQKRRQNFSFGSDDFGLFPPIKTDSPSAASVAGKEKGPFFDSVPSTPLFNSGFSPRFTDSFSQHDFFGMHDTGAFAQREGLSRRGRLWYGIAWYHLKEPLEKILCQYYYYLRDVAPARLSCPILGLLPTRLPPAESLETPSTTAMPSITLPTAASSCSFRRPLAASSSFLLPLRLLPSSVHASLRSSSRIMAVSASDAGRIPVADVPVESMAVKPPSHPTYDLKAVIALPLSEDAGHLGDVTCLATVPKDMKAEAHFIAKDDGIVAGISLAQMIFNEVDPSLKVQWFAKDGDHVCKGMQFGKVYGCAHSIIVAERVVLDVDEISFLKIFYCNDVDEISFLK
ncbi:hypothetical protein OPV22_032501 [Ensete ventricosum]|uniref:nicotinate-nucleotide diphosphorylase (carboxylating) n=1 Tax=Ensete ventricosum TaxID=4639 RepID=A0AAV8PPP7_ENSVE|nr:hypothetical protein OPV22_032501 [Ensete ventricosum]